MLSFTVFVILGFLSVQVFPVALGIDTKKSGFKAFFFALILATGQAILFWLGYVLGSRFMHLMADFKNIILLIVFFLVGVRLLMETFQVRKGNRTYILDSFRVTQFAGLAQGINTFLLGLVFVFLPFERDTLTLVLFAFALVFSFAGTFTKAGKNSLSFSSLLFALGGVFLIFSSFYIGFFALQN